MATDDVISTAGNRLTTKGQETRMRILEAAAQLFRDRGAAGTSVDDVRAAASVSGSQMGHYFLDKRSLIRAVINWQADEVAQALSAPSLKELSTLGALKAWADACVRTQVESDFRAGYLMGSLFSEAAASDADLRTDVANALGRWRNLLVDGISKMRERGDLRPSADPTALGTLLLASYQGGCAMAEATRDSRPLRDSLYAAIDYVCLFTVDEVTSPLPKRWTTRHENRAYAS